VRSVGTVTVIQAKKGSAQETMTAESLSTVPELCRRGGILMKIFRTGFGTTNLEADLHTAILMGLAAMQ